MKELSLNILDIAENSLSAGATRVEITLAEKPDGWLTLTVRDNGKGMEKETLTRLCDPFFTTRTTRRVGMGVPLLRLAAEQTGGTLRIESETGENHGTVVTANFQTRHIDCTPVGDTAAHWSRWCRGIRRWISVSYTKRRGAPYSLTLPRSGRCWGRISRFPIRRF